MLELSPAMQAYEKSLLDELHRAIAIAKEARSRGLDPSLDVEIPIASDLADRVEALLGIKGVAVRIRELEQQMSREEVALRIGDDFVARKFGEKDIAGGPRPRDPHGDGPPDRRGRGGTHGRDRKDRAWQER